MTAILAIKKTFGETTHLIYGCDSLFTDGYNKLLHKNTTKFVEFPTFVVLFAGNALVQYLLEEIRDKKHITYKNYHKLLNIKDKYGARDFYNYVYNRLRDHAEELEVNCDGYKDFALIIANKEFMCGVDSHMVIESDRFVVEGSTTDHMNSILTHTYNAVKNVTQLRGLAYDAIQISIQLSTTVDYPIIIKEFEDGKNNN